MINKSKHCFAFAPINIALIKYWGKRDQKLNLPMTSSLSLTLPNKGAYVKIAETKERYKFCVNGKILKLESDAAKKIKNFLLLFSKKHFELEINTNIPVAAGLASSASIYAGIAKALNQLLNLKLTKQQMSIMARKGSGSACRSFWNGFVLWQKGKMNDGTDSHGISIPSSWSELRVGLHIIETKQKPISSREAMQITVETSPLYKKWTAKVAKDLIAIKKAIQKKDFTSFGEISEENAKFMHTTMLKAIPPINYSNKKTSEAIEKIYNLRKSGIEIYFTQDAGANLKLLFLEKNTEKIKKEFPKIEILAPFSNPKKEQVILVDKNDKSLGVAGKMYAHKNGLLHRAFSVFVLRKKNNTLEVLLQKRQKGKYHSANLWSNTCCSHPRPDEDIITAAERRLKEEMGISAKLFPTGKFIYKKVFKNGLVEHELDYVLSCFLEKDTFQVNKNEVQDYKWVELNFLLADVNKNKKLYTAWIEQALIFMGSSLDKRH